MSMLAKLSALFRGTAREAGQAVVDANALKILDQEIRDADTAQGKAREAYDGPLWIARDGDLVSMPAGGSDIGRKRLP